MKIIERSTTSSCGRGRSRASQRGGRTDSRGVLHPMLKSSSALAAQKEASLSGLRVVQRSMEDIRNSEKSEPSRFRLFTFGKQSASDVL